jgi:hypothetical protein
VPEHGQRPAEHTATRRVRRYLGVRGITVPHGATLARSTMPDRLALRSNVSSQLMGRKYIGATGLGFVANRRTSPARPGRCWCRTLQADRGALRIAFQYGAPAVRQGECQYLVRLHPGNPKRPDPDAGSPSLAALNWEGLTLRREGNPHHNQPIQHPPVGVEGMSWRRAHAATAGISPSPRIGQVGLIVEAIEVARRVKR